MSLERAVGNESSFGSVWRLAGPCLFFLAVAHPTAAEGADGHAGGSTDRAVEILREAFRNRYDLSFTAEVELVIGRREGAKRRRVLRVATLHEPGAYRALGQLTFPEYLRGMSILSISMGRKDHQAFVYLPSEARVRRISITHKDDAFLGSDLTYEDFERRYAEDCALRMLPDSETQGEGVHVVECRPVAKLKYERAEFVIAKSDSVILEIREYRAGREEPFRRMIAPRDAVTPLDEHFIATRLSFESLERNTVTDVTFRDLRSRSIDRRLFTVGALERRPDLERTSTGEDGG